MSLHAEASDPQPEEEVLFTARSDVTVEQQGEKFVVFDPLKNSFTQLGVAEYIVFRCFDGRSTTQAIADRLKQERDVIVSPAHVARLRDRLHEKQLVLRPGEEVEAQDAAVVDGTGGVLAKLVMIDLKLAVDTDLFLTRLYHRIKHVVFRPAFFVALAGLAGLALTVWLESWDRIRQQTASLDVKGSFFLYYGCISFSLCLHEGAHGVATKGFGGKVPKMGAFLYFFIVVFYTDVSASWMFKSKFRRLMVLFAGALANVLICAVSTILWRVTIQGSTWNEVFFALMTINAVAAAFTLWPLLRGDGYHILSTALEIPNLRQNANTYTAAVLRKTFVDRTTKLPKATDREALAYLCFAPLQLLFLIGFFGYVSIKTGGWLIEEVGVLGFWIIVLVLLDRVGRPVLRIIPGALKLVADALRLGLDEGPRALLALLVRPLRDAARWIARMWRVELLVAAVLGALALIPYELHISAPFEVISTGPVTIRARTSGIVERYAVKTGDRVRAGDVVAELLDDDLQLQRRVAVGELNQARARCAELEAGFRQEEIAVADVRAAAARRHTALAADELRRVKNLFDLQIASRKDLETAQAAHAVTIAQEREAGAERAMYHAGYRVEERERQRAVVRRAEQQLAWIDQRLEWTKVRAYTDGRVITRPHELQERLGQHVTDGQGVLEIVEPAQVVARLAVPEQYVSDVAVGMPVELRFFSEPDVAYQVRIDAVEAAVARRDDARTGTLGMHTPLAGIGDTIPLRTTGVAKIDAGSQSILGLLARRLHRSTWVVFWSWW